MGYIEDYYNKFNEEKRLNSRHGRVEFTVTMKYIHECIDALCHENGVTELKIADLGAGTGRYSIPLAGEGHRVTAVELVQHNLGRLRANAIKENVEIESYKGDATHLKKLASECYDITLLFGPMYHLFSKEDKVKALKEAIRITKPKGYILVAYVMNEYSVVTYAFKERNVLECAKQGRFTDDYHTISHEQDIYDYVRIEDIDELNREVGIEREKIISPDGPADYIRPFLNKLSEEEFERFIEYQMATCERKDLIGAGSHTVDILRRQ